MIIKKLVLTLIVAGCLTSCYNTRVYVGNVQSKEPLIKINKRWNSHFIVGLVPLRDAKMKPEQYVDSAANYVIKTNTSFVNGLVGFVTCGIYTPTQTTYYIPLRDIKK